MIAFPHTHNASAYPRLCATACNRVVNFSWFFSLFLLIAIPFFSGSFLGLGIFSTDTYIALGFITGLLVREILLLFPLPTSQLRTVASVVLIVLICYLLFLSDPNLLAHPLAELSFGVSSHHEALSALFATLSKDIVILMRQIPLPRSNVLLCLGAAFLMLPGVTPHRDSSSHTTTPHETPRRQLRIHVFVAAECLGIIHPVFRMTYLLNETVMLSVTSLSSLLLLVLALCMLGLMMSAYRTHHETQGYALIICYAMGSLIWSCTTRLVPIQLLIPSQGSTELIPLGLIACIALWISPYKAQDVNNHIREDHTSAPELLPHFETLTARGQECVTQLVRGDTQKEIAKTLNIKPTTVRVLLSRAYKSSTYQVLPSYRLACRTLTNQYISNLILI